MLNAPVRLRGLAGGNSVNRRRRFTATMPVIQVGGRRSVSITGQRVSFMKISVTFSRDAREQYGQSAMRRTSKHR
jgi:hypothetical protein